MMKRTSVAIFVNKPKEEVMKANLTNLKKAMKICAKAHDSKFNDWSGEAHVSIESDTVPVVSDVRTILDAFYGEHDLFLEVKWGYTIVWFDTCMYGSKREVNTDLLQMALPFGSVLS